MCRTLITTYPLFNNFTTCIQHKSVKGRPRIGHYGDKVPYPLYPITMEKYDFGQETYEVEKNYRVSMRTRTMSSTRPLKLVPKKQARQTTTNTKKGRQAGDHEDMH